MLENFFPGRKQHEVARFAFGLRPDALGAPDPKSRQAALAMLAEGLGWRTLPASIGSWSDTGRWRAGISVTKARAARLRETWRSRLESIAKALRGGGTVARFAPCCVPALARISAHLSASRSGHRPKRRAKPEQCLVQAESARGLRSHWLGGRRANLFLQGPRWVRNRRAEWHFISTYHSCLSNYCIMWWAHKDSNLGPAD